MGTRVWADYDTTTAPEDLPLRVVLDALSGLIASLEQSVTRLEHSALTRELQLEADIAASKARIAGLATAFDTDRAPASRRPAVSEEPVRPWTRHAPPAETAPVAPANAAPETAPVGAAAPDSAPSSAAVGAGHKPSIFSRITNAI